MQQTLFNIINKSEVDEIIKLSSNFCEYEVRNFIEKSKEKKQKLVEIFGSEKTDIYLGLTENEKREILEKIHTMTDMNKSSHSENEIIKKLLYCKSYEVNNRKTVEKYGLNLCEFFDHPENDIAILSFNALDFINASNNSTWDEVSCFRFGGQYFNATIALSLMPNVGIVYTLDDFGKKTSRFWVYFSEDLKSWFYTGRIYGKINSPKQKKIRLFIEKVISNYFNIDNKFINTKLNGKEIKLTGINEPIYFDSDHGIIIRHENFGDKYSLELCEATCLACGCDTVNHSDGVCEDCANTSDCAYCGDRHDNDELLSSPGGENVCQRCFDDNYFICARCNEACSNEESNFYDDYTYCNDCFDREFSNCDCCNETFGKNDLNYIDNLDVCENCKTEKFSTCFCCSDEKLYENLMEIKGKLYCNNCYMVCEFCCANFVDRCNCKKIYCMCGNEENVEFCENCKPLCTCGSAGKIFEDEIGIYCLDCIDNRII